jgi:hypothetical protein
MALVAQEVTQQLTNPEFIIDDEESLPWLGPLWARIPGRRVGVKRAAAPECSTPGRFHAVMDLARI